MTEDPKMEDSGHKCLYILAIVGTVLMFGLTAFFNAMASTFLGIEWGIYESSTGNISDIYYTTITPSGWTFSIWGVIYLWQILWILYGVTTTCRKGINGYLYYSPAIMPWYLYAVYMVNMMLNIAWLILFDRQEMFAALIVIILLLITLWLCLFFSIRAVSREGPVLIHNGFKSDPGLVVALVHNGLGVYTTWVSIATLLNLTIVMVYVADIDIDAAATLSITVLMVELLAWFLIENIALDRYTRWLITPYFVVVFALSGVINNNYVAGDTNSIYTLVLISVAAVCLISKLVIASVRQCRKPLWMGKGEPKLDPL